MKYQFFTDLVQSAIRPKLKFCVSSTRDNKKGEYIQPEDIYLVFDGVCTACSHIFPSTFRTHYTRAFSSPIFTIEVVRE